MHFKQGKFEPVRALGADRQVGKDEKASVLPAILAILEVIEG